MNFNLIRSVAALALATATPLLAHAAPQKIEQLPRVVITGKSQPALHKLVQLPRVVIEGRSLRAMALNTTTKPVTRRA
ncbi:hypothetical protein OOZ63_24000 [Paucibacter sp. PLA-PC-4]|uniref:hypothetical protein n=1 Tax=Paucibacter sp. PLA-PC-4 TaxID=2993655 RepID=UPI00224A7035|nr:hypothetical protein [Paucibacter sp. PLA-PC-4]MCX2864898.1 hypothetical protein [Paucibacter sp. PLA-PC-4]